MRSAAPGRPVMRGEGDLDLAAVPVDGLPAGTGPRCGDPGPPRPSESEEIVQVVGGVLRHAQRPALREVEISSRPGTRYLASSGPHRTPSISLLLAGVGYLQGRGTRPTDPVDVVAPRPAPTCPVGLLRQCAPVHVDGPAGHRRPRIDVLRHGGLHEAVAGATIGTSVPLVDPVDAAEVVPVGMGVDDRRHRTIAPVLPGRGRVRPWRTRQR